MSMASEEQARSDERRAANFRPTWVEIDRPGGLKLPLRMGAANFCSFRGMLMKSYVYFQGKGTFAFGPRARARLEIGSLPRLRPRVVGRIEAIPLERQVAAGVAEDRLQVGAALAGPAVHQSQRGEAGVQQVADGGGQVVIMHRLDAAGHRTARPA